MTHAPAIGLSSAGRHTLCMECGEPWPCRSVGDSPTVSEPRTPTAVALVARYRSSNPDDWPEPGELVRAIPTIEAEAAQPIDVERLQRAMEWFDVEGWKAQPDTYGFAQEAEAVAAEYARLRASDTDHD